MAFEFPASPTTGQVSNGYQWDGEKWKGGQPSGPQKETLVDFSGKSSVDVAVPTWAKACRITSAITAIAPGGSMQCRISGDGTTFAAGASDYVNAAPYHVAGEPTGSAGFKTVAQNNLNAMQLSIAADNVSLAHMMTVEITLQRASTGEVFTYHAHSTALHNTASLNFATAWYQGWVAASATTSLSVKALRIFGLTGKAGSHIHIQWLGDDSQIPISNAISEAYADTRYVNVTGDTMSGDLTISKAAPILFMNKPASGSHTGIISATNNLARWLFSVGDDAVETGSNAGSNFMVYRANDAGTYVDVPLQINRATGVVTATGLPPKPTVTAGVGQWVNVTSATGGAWILPAGGTWAYMYAGYNVGSLVWAVAIAAGVAAGGSTMQAGLTNVSIQGFCWRIA